MVKRHEHHSKMGAKHHVVMTDAQYRRHLKGTPSLTRKNRLDYETHRGDKDFHRMGHDVKGTPFRKKRTTTRRRIRY